MEEVVRAGGQILDIEFCPHSPTDGCKCRKPEPGMLLRLAELYSLNLRKGYYVGDSMKDLEAAKAAACKGVLVLSGNGKKPLSMVAGYEPVHADLAGFVTHLLSV